MGSESVSVDKSTTDIVCEAPEKTCRDNAWQRLTASSCLLLGALFIRKMGDFKKRLAGESFQIPTVSWDTLKVQEHHGGKSRMKAVPMSILSSCVSSYGQYAHAW